MAAFKLALPFEWQEQATFVEWLDFKHTNHFAIPNGEKRHIAVAKKLKKMGVKPGVPDLMLPYARKNYHGLFIEMKRQKGGSMSEEQKNWHKFLLTEGYQVMIAKGAEHAIDCFNDYFY